jgi:hypothetical protein
MQLSTNEQVVRQWDYATSKTGMIDLNKTQATLTVTNKRIVHDVRNKLEISRTEVQLKDVKTVHMTQARKSIVGPVLAIILGIVLAIVGLVLMVSDEAMAIVGVLLLVVGAIVAIFLGVLRLRGGAFTLELYTYGISEESLTIGARGGTNIGKKKNSSKIQVVVNNDVAFDIVECLTAIVLEAKEIAPQA